MLVVTLEATTLGCVALTPMLSTVPHLAVHGWLVVICLSLSLYLHYRQVWCNIQYFDWASNLEHNLKRSRLSLEGQVFKSV